VPPVQATPSCPKPCAERKVREIRNLNEKLTAERTVGQKIADSVASGMGSWRFIIIQTLVVVVWMILNMVAFMHHWDPFPFILLNLVFSTQAAYAAPIIMMSQNRSAERDRAQAQNDYETNIAAKEEIEQLMRRLDAIEENKLDKILSILEKGK
jgi:uncharacterized membrane protein